MKRLILSVVVVLISVSGALAQLPTGTILGTVKDQSGAIIPGATVTVRETATNQVRTGKTGQDGNYRFNALPVGTYQLRVEQAGFQTAVQSGLTLSVGQQLESNFSLQVGATTQSVEVSVDSANLVDTTSSTVGSLVNQQQIAELPLNGRNYQDLTMLQPGVTKSLNSNISQIGYNGTSYSSNGATQRSNMYLLDGAIQVSLSGNNGSSALGTTLGLDGIQEFKVITSSFDAEYGMVMGSTMTIVTKSGTNAFHGSVFEFVRNNVFDARNYFDLPPSKLLGPIQADGTQRQYRNPAFRRNQFGGSFGGPIRKDKTFFFLTYEGLRAVLQTTNTATTLGTEANPNGCKAPAGATVTVAQCPQLGAAQATVAPQMAAFLQLWPTPNLPGTANNYGFGFGQNTPEDFGQVRIDHTISAKDSLFGRYTIDQSFLPFTGNFNQSYINENSRNQFLTFAESHVFSNNIVNSARASFTREPLLYSLTITDPGYKNPNVIFVPGQPMGAVNVSGLTGLGPSLVAPRFEIENIYTGSDDLNVIRGRHSLKFGALFNHYQYYVQQHGPDHGSLGFGSLAALMQGGPTISFVLDVPGADNVTRYFKFNTMGFYAQDSWKMNSRLTLNYGLRYEPTTTITEIHGNAGILPNFPASAVFVKGSAAMTNPSLKNFSPRVGFALDVFGNGKTALRGGADILYDLSTHGTGLANTSGFGPPESQNISLTSYTTQYGPVKIPLVTPLPNTPDNPNRFQMSFRGLWYKESQPKLISYNVSLQQQLPAHMQIMLAYVGSHAIDITQNIERNNVLPSGRPGVDALGNRVCNEVPFGTITSYVNEYDSPDATDCYAISTTTHKQCWPSGGLLPNSGTVVPGNTTDCWSRENSDLLSLASVQNTGEAYYNGLSVTINRSMSRGLQYQAAYTYSKLNDNTQGETTVDGNDEQQLPFHPHTAYGPALFDVRNNFHFNAVYHLPEFAHNNGFLKQIVNGWGTNGIFSYQTGYPFGVIYSGDRSNVSYLPGYASRTEPDLVPGRNSYNITHGVSTPDPMFPNNCATAGQKLGTTKLYYDPCAFRIQPAGFIGTEPRNFLRGPKYSDIDLSITKDWHVKERFGLQFRAEGFNIPNHPTFVLPNTSISSGACSSPSACAMNPVGTAGTISSTTKNTGGLPGGSRQLQFGLRMTY